jgi:energy-coupling factor transporter ATP-binding protein EcfA2
MPIKAITITALPTRYEPLTNAFGDKAKMTFVLGNDDISAAKRFIAAAESARQGKLLFVSAESGAGKSTFVHSLEIFLSDKVQSVIRLPPPHELEVAAIPGYLARLPVAPKFTIVNFDGREAPYFNEPEYQTFLGALNGVLRQRPDLLVFWPVTDEGFAQKLIALLQKVGGTSAFGLNPLYKLVGVVKEQYQLVLEKILQIANWRLDDAAVSTTEVDTLVQENERVGAFLDSLQRLIAQRFDVGGVGVAFPTLTLVISSGEPKIREICRSLRRADSYYIEASRLLMYTRRSNVAEWWQNRATHLKSALPHVIALLNAQLVSMSASSVVHSVLQFGEPSLRSLAGGVRADRGNAKRVMSSSELFKFVQGEAVDNREYGSSVGTETYDSYARIQAASETRHRAINESILQLVQDAGATLQSLAYEQNLVRGLQTDATYQGVAGTIALEFHHKAAAESTNNKIAIYVLEKLKEYAVNYGLADR